MNERIKYEEEVAKLLAKKWDYTTGMDIWAYIRRCAADIMVLEGHEEIGSSDVSGVVYQYWLDTYRLTKRANCWGSVEWAIKTDIQRHHWHAKPENKEHSYCVPQPICQRA